MINTYSDINIFETNDFSNMKIYDFEEDSKIFYMDNFYKYPNLVLSYLNSITPPVWKSWESPSKNMIDFEDRRHHIHHNGMIEVHKKLSSLCCQEPTSEYTSIVSNYTRFKKCPENDYLNNYWWPHFDIGYNGIVYLNDYEEEYEGTNLYSMNSKNKEDYKRRLDQKIPEHTDPWTPKSNWSIILKIKAKFNRFVMFDGSKYWHGMSIFDDRWFGKNFSDASYRINQVLFFSK